MALHPDYCTSAELKAYITTVSATDDSRIALAITAASRAIETATDRQFGVLSVAAARYYSVCRYGDGRYIAEVDDFQSAAGLVVKFDLDDDYTYETTTTAFRKLPLNAASDTLPWTQLAFNSGTTVSLTKDALEVTALWGWTAVPDTIKQATLLQASRFFKRKDAPFGVAGSPEMGNELRLLAKCDPDVEVMIQAYRADWLVA